ncbi:MAG: hypothetical protein V3U03_13480 [Myxococcota bacterium]
MADSRSGLVDIVREFLAAHQMMRRLFARYRRGELRFVELEELVGDGEVAVLFRLKERCHALFRPAARGKGVAMRRAALFDLAVGSLFHEAMKFRENFYQREVYGPRVRALRSAAGEETDALFQEFEKILGIVSTRLVEGLEETETLLAQTSEQLGVLLKEHRDDPFVTRYLLENRASASEVFGADLDELFTRIYGDAAQAYALAGRSYLASGHYDVAESTIAEAIARRGEADDLELLSSYARGMAAYLAGDYERCVQQLGRWAGGADGDAGRADLAQAAVSKIDQLAEGDSRARVLVAASALLERIASARGRSGGADGEQRAGAGEVGQAGAAAERRR